MTDKSRRAGSMAVLAGGILVAVVLIVIFLVPVATCRSCRIDRAVQRGLGPLKSKPLHLPEVPLDGCDHCWRGRMTLYRKWTIDR